MRGGEVGQGASSLKPALCPVVMGAIESFPRTGLARTSMMKLHEPVHQVYPLKFGSVPWTGSEQGGVEGLRPTRAAAKKAPSRALEGPGWDPTPGTHCSSWHPLLTCVPPSPPRFER